MAYKYVKDIPEDLKNELTSVYDSNKHNTIPDLVRLMKGKLTKYQINTLINEYLENAKKKML